MFSKRANFSVPTYRPDDLGFGPLEDCGRIQTGGPCRAAVETIEILDTLNTGASLIYAGYPYDPYASDAPAS